MVKSRSAGFRHTVIHHMQMREMQGLNRGVTLHIFAVIKLKCAVIKSKLGSVKNQS